MGKLSFGRVLDYLCISPPGLGSCFSTDVLKPEDDDEFEKWPLIASDDQKGHVLRVKDVVQEKQTLAFQLQPKMVVMRVSMHCNGCARKVEKHISKMEGVTWYKVDLEERMVIVKGDIVPIEVLDSVSKVMKSAQIWTTSPSS